jgi:hypothetical protein
VQPEEAVFSVTVSSGVDKSLDDVVAAVTGLGITATNLVQISSPLTAGSSSVPLPSNVPAPSLGWTFQLAVPFSEMKDTTAALASLQKFYLTKQQWAFTYLLVVKHTDLRAANPQLQSRRPGDEGAWAGTGYRRCRGIQGRRDRRPHQRVERCSAYLLADRPLLDGSYSDNKNLISLLRTRTNNVQPDQVLIGLRVTSSTTAGLDDIAGALTGAGITGANFAGVYTSTIYTTSGGFPTPQNELFYRSP